MRRARTVRVTSAQACGWLQAAGVSFGLCRRCLDDAGRVCSASERAGGAPVLDWLRQHGSMLGPVWSRISPGAVV